METSGPRIRFRLARALLHLNQLASLSPFFETNDDVDELPTDRRERGLISWVPPPSAILPSSPRDTTSLATHGDLPNRMVTNPEPALRPAPASTTPRSCRNSRRPAAATEGTSTGSSDPLPMAAPRATKRPRRSSPPPTTPLSTHLIPSCRTLILLLYLSQ